MTMHLDDLADLTALSAVAELRSFTRAAQRLNVSQSALSRAVRSLEDRHGVVLLARTMRSVSTTEAGQQLLETVRPSLELIEDQLAVLQRWRERPAGRLRLTMPRQAAIAVLWPVLPRFLAENPDVEIEVCADERRVDLVGNRLDAGIRFGLEVEKDMVAVRVGKPMRAAVVAAPSYFDARTIPTTPADLSGHRCINLSPYGDGVVRPWRFSSNGIEKALKPNGGPTFNDDHLVVGAALDGLGLAYLFEDQVREHLHDGRLRRVLADFCVPFPGYHLYYPDRRQVRPALRRLIDLLKEVDRAELTPDPEQAPRASCKDNNGVASAVTRQRSPDPRPPAAPRTRSTMRNRGARCP